MSLPNCVDIKMIDKHGTCFIVDWVNINEEVNGFKAGMVCISVSPY